MFQNPYGDPSSELDPAAARRQALLDMMDPQAGAPSPGTPFAPPTSRLPIPDVMTAAQQPGQARVQVPGLEAPEPSGAVNPYGGGQTAPTAPTAPGDNGLQYGSKVLDLYSAPYNRRGGGTGGVGSGALKGASLGSAAGPIGAGVGAVIGGIVGAAKKHAATAPTDFTVQDATAIIKDSYRDMFGRDATAQEVQDALTGQGWHPGSRYVGQQGLQGVLGHLAENAAAQRAAGPAPGAGGPAATGAGSPLATNPNTGITGGMDTRAPSGAASGAGGVPSTLEGFDAGKFGDPNKHDTKYDFARIAAQYPPTSAGLDQAWDQITQQFPHAQRIGDDKVDFGDGFGAVDVIRASGEGGKAWHFEPADGGGSGSAASAAPAAASPSLPTLPGAGQLAAPLTNNNVLQQIMDEVQRIQRGDAPRNAILQQMGVD
jgi:hypothetical protein